MTMPYACTRCMMPTEEAVCPVCGAKTENAQRIRDALPPQTILHGQYLLGAALGGGGFGTTYRALKLESVDPVRGEMVAVKEYFPHSIAARSDDGRVVPQRNDAKLFTNWRDKFVTEYNMLLEASRCPSVVQVLDLFEENNTAYLVMAYVEGETLAHRVEAHGAIPPEELMRMMKPFIENLRMLHEKKIIHRDIKPANIILKGGDTPILLDFGSARPNDPELRKTVMISKGYAPLEQYTPNGHQGCWTDVYGLCATMYFALTGQQPADALDRYASNKEKSRDPLVPIQKLCPKLKSQWADALMAGLAMESGERPSSFTKLETALFSESKPDAPKPAPIIDSVQTTRTLLAAKRAGNLLKRFAPQKYEGILREIDRISRLSSIAQQAESLQQLLQGSGVIFRLLTNGFRATKP